MTHVAACVFLHVTPSHLTACLALLLCIDVDGGLIDTCECVVPWIVSGRKTCKNGHHLITNFELTNDQFSLQKFTAAENRFFLSVFGFMLK